MRSCRRIRVCGWDGTCIVATNPRRFASLPLQQVESIVYLKEQVDHASIQITVDTYGHLIQARTARPSTALDDAPAHPNATQAQPQLQIAVDADRNEALWRVETLNFTSWNQMVIWLSQLQALRQAA